MLNLLTAAVLPVAYLVFVVGTAYICIETILLGEPRRLRKRGRR